MDPGLGRQVALLTALLAALSALLSYGVTDTQNHAVLTKNAAVLTMLRAAALRENSRPGRSARVRGLERRALTQDRASERLMGPHDHFAQGLVAAEIGVALASVAALVERRWLLRLAQGAALLALVLGAFGLMS